jgi:hypothetical protein
MLDGFSNWKLSKAKLPALYATEHDKDPMVKAKLFTPWSSWTWFLTEADPKTGLAFGFASSHTGSGELGYISLAEMREIKGPAGLMIEQDDWWDAVPLSEAKKQVSC